MALMLRILPAPSSPTKTLRDYEHEALKIAIWSDNRVAKMQHLLIKLGVPTHLRGYWYLTWMLDQMTMGLASLDYATKELYPNTAKVFGVTTAAVERDVRYLLRWTWLNGDPATLAEFTGKYSDSAPSNSRFMRIFMNHMNYNTELSLAA